MDETYDCIVLGTGLKECMLSGLMSIEGKKVLHMDRNDYYGGESASLNLTQMYERFREGKEPDEALGKDRDYNIDLIPKFLMGDGDLVKLLVYTTTNRYLDFKVLDGSFVYRDGAIHKVPATTAEIVSSPLMGWWEKNRCRKMFEFIGKYDEANPKTHGGIDLDKSTVRDVYEKFGVQDNTIDFVGHGCACYLNDDYFDLPARDLFERIILYVRSLARYEKSPYLYPLYGLGELPQSFARLSAVCGGTYMLRKPIDEIVYDESGKATGVTSEGETVSSEFIIADPSYFPEKVENVGKVVRSICILSHPVDNTFNAESAQIIMPQKQINRANDIYISVVSYAHNVAAPGKWLAIASTTVETDDPEAELAPALALLQPVDEVFTQVSDMYVPTNDPKEDGVFITTSYDATSHFQTTCADVMAVYERIMGKPLDLDNPPKMGEDAEE